MLEPEVAAQMAAVIERERSRFGVPGCAVVLIRHGEVLLKRGFGLRDVEAGLPVETGTLFPIGSSTKTFTAAVLAREVEEGLLRWDQPIRQLLPGFRMFDPQATEHLTVRDCLAHRSGLPRHDIIWYAGAGVITRDELIRALEHLPPAAPFRERWDYNNLLYVLAGELAGRLIGGSFEDAVRRFILEPLQMYRTNFEVATTLADPNHALPYADVGEGQPLRLQHADLSLVGPAGNINSCADDLVPWMLALTGRSNSEARPLLSADSLDQLGTPVVTMPQGLPRPSVNLGYGLGTVIEDYRGTRLMHHSGNIDGFSATVCVAPERGLGIGVLTNMHLTGLRDALPYLLLDIIDEVDLNGPDHGASFLDALTAARTATAAMMAAHTTGTNSLPAVRPFLDYAGIYTHAGYGDLVVGLGQHGLHLSYGVLTGPMAHRHLEVFTATFTIAGTRFPIALQFTHDMNGDVAALLARMQDGIPPLVFPRRPATASAP